MHQPVQGSPPPGRQMSEAEARKVLWLRTNPRPLGELLDEHYLTEERLRWAAKKAYNSQLRQAAAVLLAVMQQKPTAAKELGTVESYVSADRAAATPWPFRPWRGQAMGPLVDAHRLTLKDLGYAVENAWDERVRQAAIVLLARRLKQAVKEKKPPAGPLKVVKSGRSHSESEQYRWTFLSGCLNGALAVIFVWCLTRTVMPLLSGKARNNPVQLATLEQWIALGIVLGGTAVIVFLLGRVVDWLTNRIEHNIEANRKGQDGEDAVVEALRQHLDGEWTLFRNIVLPGGKGDLDGVLLGPTGVWLLEIKNYSGAYRNVGEQWHYRAGTKWRLMKKSPGRQARRNAAALATILRADKLQQWVEAVVVWANGESPLTIKSPMVAVWRYNQLPEELGNLWGRRRLPEFKRAQLLEKLSALCRPDGDESAPDEREVA